MKKLTKVLIISNEVVHVTFPMREKLFIPKTNYMFCIGVILLNKIGINVKCRKDPKRIFIMVKDTFSKMNIFQDILFIRLTSIGTASSLSISGNLSL